MQDAETCAYAYLPVVDRDVAALIPDVIAGLEPGLAPSTDDQIERMIVKIALLYPNGKLSDGETAARLELYIDLLRDIPFDILASAFRRIAQTSRFFPTVAELREVAAPELGKRQAKIGNLKRLLFKHEREWSPPFDESQRCSPEDVARIKAEVAAELSAGRP